MTASAAGVTRRPRDRKQRIVNAAAALFRERGFHNVALAQVAGEVGITAGALYRHFRGKEELLLHAVLAGFDATDAMVSTSTDVEDLIHRAATLATERTGLGALWQREARHLGDEQRAALQRRMNETADRLVALVGTERPDLRQPDLDVIAHALLSAFASFGVHRITLSKREFERVHRDLALRIARCRFTTPVVPRPPRPTHDQEVSRHELLLNEAARLFDERGYHSVNMSDIGAAAGIAGSSVYQHFESKNDLLRAAFARGTEYRTRGMVCALATGEGPAETLEMLLRAHIDFATEHKRLIGILVSERAELPTKDRLETYREQRKYYRVWTAPLAELRPAVAPPVLKIILDTVFAVINNVTRVPRIADRPEIAARLLDLTTALMRPSAVEPSASTV